MNQPRMFESSKFQHKLCVERSEPEKYIKNCLSTEALQFAGDFSIELGIRQIGQFGIIHDFKKSNDQFDWSQQLRFEKEPYINSAFRLTKSTTNFYKFVLLKFSSANKIIYGDLCLRQDNRNQFKKASKGEIVPGIKQSLALKVVELFKTHRENDIGHTLIEFFIIL